MAFIPSYWRETPQRYRYEGNMCPTRGKIFFPPRLVSSPWSKTKLKPCKLATEGKIKTYTIIHIAPPGFGDEAPYALAVLEMNDGARLTAQVVDVPLDKVKVGMKVKIEFRKIQKDGHAGILQYGYKAVPA
jgi:uncharacterized OB-fold protein